MKTKIGRIITSITLASLALPVFADQDAKGTWEKSCAMCHGKDGKGDTTMGKKLKARDYTDAKVQDSLKDEDLIKGIKEGVKEGGKTLMRGFDKLSDDEVKALVAYMRGLKK